MALVGVRFRLRKLMSAPAFLQNARGKSRHRVFKLVEL